MNSSSFADDFRFFKSFLARPLTVASPIPSGPALAAKIAAQIDPAPGGFVLELGPGTGAVTRAICERIEEQELIAVESDAEFLRLLRGEFPRATVIEGDAFAFAEILGDRAHGLRTIVSGLPVVGQPRDLLRGFLQTAIDALGPGRPFVQFSYSPRPPFPRVEGVDVTRAAIVWQNIPPMHIWVYRHSVGSVPRER